MAEFPYTDASLGAICRSLADDYAPIRGRNRVRRLLINMGSEASASNATGTNVPEPFDKSSLIVKTLIGDVPKAVQLYTASIAANGPVVQVTPFAARGDGLTKTVDKRSGEQERLLMALADSMDLRRKQWRVAWSQSWGRVGYYLTLPRDAQWGLPDRQVYDDLTDEQIERFKQEGAISPVSTERGGKRVYYEAADIWEGRRADAAKNNALALKSLFTLESLAADEVELREDADGVKYAVITQEVPADTFKAGSEPAKTAAKYDKGFDGDIEDYGLTLDSHGKVSGGASLGRPAGGVMAPRTWTFKRFFDREWACYFVAPAGADSAAGKIIWAGRHGAMVAGSPVCPVVPVPCMETDSGDPSHRYSTPMEQVFAFAPIINQLETLLSNVAAYNAIPRWVVEGVDGALLRNAETGEPVVVDEGPAPGMDPKQAAAYPGTLKQLTIDAGGLIQLLAFYAEQLANVMPGQAVSGEGGASGVAWVVRQLIERHNLLLTQPVEHHARAVRQMMLMWTGWLRLLDTKVYIFPAPGHRASQRSVRGLIEFDPKDLTDAIVVTQDSHDASARTVLRQHGLELFYGGGDGRPGVIDAEQLFEEYFQEQDAHEAVMRMYVQQVVDHVVGGKPLLPDSLLATVAEMVKGRVMHMLVQRSPNAAQGMAEQMAMQTRQQAAPPNVAGVAGIRQAGMGMASDLPGNPSMGAPGVGVQPTVTAGI